MGKKKIAIPLILILAVSAAAIPFVTGLFGGDSGTPDGDGTASDGTESPSAGHADAQQGEDDDAGQTGAGSPAGDLRIDDLLTAADPTSPAGDTIRSRLAPLTATANASVEPFPTPPPTTLYQATLLHPAHTPADLVYVESLQPLPRDLETALARVVIAHAVSTQQLSQPNPPPGANLAAAVTMATALDTAMPTLERYIDHPVWDRQAGDEAEQASTASLSAPPLGEALMELYDALGYGPDTLDALEPQAMAAAEQLGPERSQALARLVFAQAKIQRASAASLLFLATPASHTDDPVDESTGAVDDAVEGSPLEALTQATQQLRSAADAADQAFHEAPVGEPVREQAWTDPLGLIVVGTQGEESYDARYGGSPMERTLAQAVTGTARSTAGETTVNTTDASVGPTTEDATTGGSSSEAGVDASNGSAVPEPGWHMLVVDPGGDDTYRNNAGGIDAGEVIVRADVDASGAVTGATSVFLQGDRLCTPGITFCEPGSMVGSLLRQATFGGPEAHQGPVPIGIPLTAAVVDLGGDDHYTDQGPVIQGAARGLGVGLLFDARGNDTYEAGKIAQGASERYGIGLLVDADGHDTYNATRRAQGWVDLPNPNATVRSAGLFLPEQEFRSELARTAEGSLIDTGGEDEYLIEEQTGGQGVVEVPEGWLRRVTEQFTMVPERLTAQLVDVGGNETLPIPEIQLTRETVKMHPSWVNVSSRDQVHFWLTRRVPEPSRSINSASDFLSAEDVTRFKTAMHVDPNALPNPISEDAIRAGNVNVTCRAGGDGPGLISAGGRGSFPEQVACGFGNFVQTPPLLLFGEPAHVHDPPALTLTFGGDTRYNGSIASVQGEEAQEQEFFSEIAQIGVPRILTDLQGNDTYTGGNHTIASVTQAGTAMVIDRSGDDRMEAGNRSVGYVESPVGHGNAGVATVIDLDGELTVRSHNRSQAYASKIDSRATTEERGLICDPQSGGCAGPSVPFPRGTLVPPLALVDAGAQSDAQPDADTQVNVSAPGLNLQARNMSQGYSRGLGVALVVGSSQADTYEVDGWGQGVHENQQILARFCEGVEEPAGLPGLPGDDPRGGPTTSAVNSQLASLTPWLGGVGAVVDPAGNDAYTVDSGVGLGDAVMLHGEEQVCENGPRSIGGEKNVNVLGLGTLLDVRGRDDYQITETPPRPDRFPPRSCSGPNRTECEPQDDSAWMAIDEIDQAETAALVTVEGPGVIGFGVDNVRNAHHLGMAACRNYDSVTYGRQGELVEVSVNGTTGLGPASKGECDETLDALWSEYLSSVIEENVPIDRTPDLELSLPRQAPAASATASQTADSGEETGTDRLPVPIDPDTPDDAQPLFLGDAARPQCQDREPAREVVARGAFDMACLSITRDINLGQWFTSNPGASRLDPGDTIGCNCSVGLEIAAVQGGREVQLRTLDDRGLYPDRGRVTTFTDQTQSWYQAYNRFRIPLTVEDPIQDGRLRGDFVQAEASADFPINLSKLPSGLARVQVTAVVEDVAAEETGGAVPATVEQWTPALVNERSFERAYLSTVDGETYAFLSAPGPVAADTQLTVDLSGADAEAREEVSDNDWRRASGANLTRTVPDEVVIDGPSINPIIPQEGSPACAAEILRQETDGQGVCWTGAHLVVALPLGEVTQADVQAVRAGSHALPLETIDLGESEAEPQLLYESEEAYSIDLGALGSKDVRGLPGTKVLDEGANLTRELVDERPERRWAQITVQADHDQAIGAYALTPSLPGDLHAFPNHTHVEEHRVLGSGALDHAHVDVIQPNRTRPSDAPVVLDEALTYPGDTDHFAMGCINLNYADVDDVERILAEQNDREDLWLRQASCLTMAQEGQLVYLVPLGERTGTQLVRLETMLMQTDGDVVTEEITAHIDPVGAQGQVFVDPTAARTALTDVSLQVFPQTAESPRLTSAPSTPDADSDLLEVGLQARAANGTWTPLGDVWNKLPTPRKPTVETTVDLTPFVDPQVNTSVLQVRGKLVDESNNTLFTSARDFIVDRTAPSILDARIVSGAGQDRLILTVDEAVASVDCLTEECMLETEQRVPGAQPEPFLAMSKLQQGTRTITIPILDLERGPTYHVQLELTDTLGNDAVRNITVDTFTPLAVDASPMTDTLVNKTITLNWTTETVGDQTLSTFTSAYLMLPEGPCAVLKAEPGVVSASSAQSREAGPLSVRGEAGERTCTVPDNGTDATLLIYALAPNVDALALDEVPVHVDTTAPTVNATVPDGWVNRTVTVEASSNDTLPTELEVFVDGEPRPVDESPAEVSVSGEGVHDVLVRATDAAGNVAVNRTEVRIDRTPPTVQAEVLGVRGGLALVNATATDEPSSIRDVQLSTRSTSGPVVPGIGGQAVLLSVPVEAGEDEVVLRAHDQAANARDLRLSLEDVPRVESGPLVSGLTLTTPAPDTLEIGFETTNATSPVVILDAGDRHVERVLEPGREHSLTVDRLSPGRQAQVTVTVPRGSDLVPAVNGTVTLPDDQQPPTRLTDVEAEPVEGGVRLTWESAQDNVGVREVVVERDGSEVARTSAETLLDEPRTYQEHTYKLAAVDRAGNRGPWTSVDAKPIATFQITNLTSEPETLTPQQPVTVRATVQTPAGLEPDLVTLDVGDRTFPMQAKDVGPYTSTYELTTRLPALNVTSTDAELVVNATAGDRSESRAFPAPVVSTSGTTNTPGTPSEVPGFQLVSVLSLTAAVALARRRWSL